MASFSPTADHYNHPDAKQFIADLAGAHQIRHYEGRNAYEGPAVYVDSREEAMAATTIVCAWDNLGKQFVVHPRTKCVLNAAGVAAQNKFYSK